VSIIAGKFITLEGGEGVGKTTQLKVIESVLCDVGIAVQVTREPGGTPRAEHIRELLLSRDHEPMPESCELLLMFAARATHLHNVVRPALARGEWVLCDRFTDATYAYQGYGRGVSMERIAELENLVQTGLKPDITLLLDAPTDQALGRMRARHAQQGAAADRFEIEQQAFFERVRAGYLARAAAEPRRIRVIDAAQSLIRVSDAVQQIVREFVAHIRQTNP